MHSDSKIFVTQLEVEFKSTLAALQAAHKAGVKTLFNPSPARAGGSAMGYFACLCAPSVGPG